MEAPDFWNDADKAQKFVIELKSLKDTIGKLNHLQSQFEDIQTLIQMGYEENDEAILEDVEQEFEAFREEFEELRVSTLLSEEYDKDGAILTLHAGAGGTES